MPNTQKARVFRNGRSQAIRIPAEFRFTTDEVYVERNSETGALTLTRSSSAPRWTIFSGISMRLAPPTSN